MKLPRHVQAGEEKAKALHLLWLKLKKEFLAASRLAAGVLLALAILNVGLGAGALVDARPFDPTAPGELLHLQVFGFFHLHESLNETATTPGVTEYDAGVLTLPPTYTRFGYLDHSTRLSGSEAGLPGQKLSTDFPGPHTLAGIKKLVPLARPGPADEHPLPDPFLKAPLKPPVA